jgi:hypothetical protein
MSEIEFHAPKALAMQTGEFFGKVFAKALPSWKHAKNNQFRVCRQNKLTPKKLWR